MAKLSGRNGRIKIGSSSSVTGAVATGASVVVTSGLSVAVGDWVLISSVTGLTDLNNSGKGHQVTAKGTGTFTVILPASTSQTYTSGGTAQRIIPVSEWNLDVKGEVADVTDSESGSWKEHIDTGHKSWSGTFKGFWNDAQTEPLMGSYAVELDLNSTNYYSGTAIFDAFSIGVKIPGADAVALSGNFTGTGALVKT